MTKKEKREGKISIINNSTFFSIMQGKNIFIFPRLWYSTYLITLPPYRPLISWCSSTMVGSCQPCRNLTRGRNMTQDSSNQSINQTTMFLPCLDVVDLELVHADVVGLQLLFVQGDHLKQGVIQPSKKRILSRSFINKKGTINQSSQMEKLL